MYAFDELESTRRAIMLGPHRAHAHRGRSPSPPGGEANPRRDKSRNPSGRRSGDRNPVQAQRRARVAKRGCLADALTPTSSRALRVSSPTSVSEDFASANTAHANFASSTAGSVRVRCSLAVRERKRPGLGVADGSAHSRLNVFNRAK